VLSLSPLNARGVERMKHQACTKTANIKYVVQASSVFVSAVSSSGFEAAVFAKSVRGLTGFLYDPLSASPS
jgi:hypothetical protein